MSATEVEHTTPASPNAGKHKWTIQIKSLKDYVSVISGIKKQAYVNSEQYPIDLQKVMDQRLPVTMTAFKEDNPAAKPAELKAMEKGVREQIVKDVQKSKKIRLGRGVVETLDEWIRQNMEHIRRLQPYNPTGASDMPSDCNIVFINAFFDKAYKGFSCKSTPAHRDDDRKTLEPIVRHIMYEAVELACHCGRQTIHPGDVRIIINTLQPVLFQSERVVEVKPRSSPAAKAAAAAAEAEAAVEGAPAPKRKRARTEAAADKVEGAPAPKRKGAGKKAPSKE
jgi:hypothetical protein